MLNLIIGIIIGILTSITFLMIEIVITARKQISLLELLTNKTKDVVKNNDSALIIEEPQDINNLLK